MRRCVGEKRSRIKFLCNYRSTSSALLVPLHYAIEEEEQRKVQNRSYHLIIYERNENESYVIIYNRNKRIFISESNIRACSYGERFPGTFPFRRENRSAEIQSHIALPKAFA